MRALREVENSNTNCMSGLLQPVTAFLCTYRSGATC